VCRAVTTSRPRKERSNGATIELIPRDEPKEGDANGIGRRIAALAKHAVAERARKKAKIAHGHNTVTYPIDLTCGRLYTREVQERISSRAPRGPDEASSPQGIRGSAVSVVSARLMCD
jgi:hypothetical protein